MKRTLRRRGATTFHVERRADPARSPLIFIRVGNPVRGWQASCPRSVAEASGGPGRGAECHIDQRLVRVGAPLKGGTQEGGPGGTAAKPRRIRKVTGWQPSCAHDVEPVPCVVLDPFAGIGRTWEAARETGRRFVGTDLGPGYCRLALSRNDLAAMKRRKVADAAKTITGPLFTGEPSPSPRNRSPFKRRG